MHSQTKNFVFAIPLRQISVSLMLTFLSQKMASYLLNLLFMSGKYLTRTAGLTLMQLLRGSVEIQQKLVNGYDRAFLVVGPHKNMLEVNHRT